MEVFYHTKMENFGFFRQKVGSLTYYKRGFIIKRWEIFGFFAKRGGCGGLAHSEISLSEKSGGIQNWGIQVTAPLIVIVSRKNLANPVPPKQNLFTLLFIFLHLSLTQKSFKMTPKKFPNAVFFNNLVPSTSPMQWYCPSTPNDPKWSKYEKQN